MRISDWSSDVCSSDLEFELIERYFAPLAAKADGTFGLHNDAAVLPVGPGERLVATVATLIEGRPFLDCPPDLAARKRPRGNLPDPPAMGARPFRQPPPSAVPLALDEDWRAPLHAAR